MKTTPRKQEVTTDQPNGSVLVVDRVGQKEKLEKI
jgi:hypothetical protein